jgi:hypothetical protein
MEAKLERAIQHVQHLQRAGRERQQQQQQQQQAAALQPDTTPLATTAEDMQVRRSWTQRVAHSTRPTAPWHH